MTTSPAHDDEQVDSLYSEFSDDFDRADAALSTVCGNPLRTRSEDDDAIPLKGVLRFATWDAGDTVLFLASAHEDRGAPILLSLRTA